MFFQRKRHELVEGLDNVKSTLDEKMSGAKLRLLGGSVPLGDSDGEEEEDYMIGDDEDDDALEVRQTVYSYAQNGMVRLFLSFYALI